MDFRGMETRKYLGRPPPVGENDRYEQLRGRHRSPNIQLNQSFVSVFKGKGKYNRYEKIKSKIRLQRYEG